MAHQEIGNEPFVFDSEFGFTISGHGLVFSGRVRSGVAAVGDRVLVKGDGGHFTATIDKIEKDRKLIDQTVADQDIGLLVNKISDSKVEKLLYVPGYQDRGLDSPDEIDAEAEFAEHGLVFPVVISKVESPAFGIRKFFGRS